MGHTGDLSGSSIGRVRVGGDITNSPEVQSCKKQCPKKETMSNRSQESIGLTDSLRSS
jgi:hypothetical protein